jgi:hypothetical protein
MYLSLLLIQETQDFSLQKGSALFRQQLFYLQTSSEMSKKCSQSRSLENLKNQVSVGAQELKIEQARADGKKSVPN